MCNDLAVIHASYPSCRIDRKGKEMKKMEGRGEKEKEEMKSEEGRKKRKEFLVAWIVDRSAYLLTWMTGEI